MFFYIFAAVVILAGGTFIASRNLSDLKQFSAIMTASVSFAVSALVFPYFLKNQYDLLLVLLKSLRYGISAVTMSVNTDVLETLALPSPVREIYKTVLYGMYILGPVFASLTLMSFSRSVMEAAGRLFSRRIHVFTRMNPESVLIAESLKSRKKEMLVFCSAFSSGDDSLRIRARNTAALLLNKNEKNIRLKKNASYEFYVMDSTPEQVLMRMEELCSSLLQKPGYVKDNIIIRCFIDRTNMELIRHLDGKYGKKLRIRYLDPVNSAAVDILRRQKDALAGKEHNEIFIFGAGQEGMALLRNLSCLLIQPGHTSRIRVFDENAENAAKALKAKCPEFLNLDTDCCLQADDVPGMNYNIHFHPYRRENLLPDHLADYPQPDHIFICENGDTLNYAAAKALKRFYAARNDDLSYPALSVLIQSPQLNAMIDEKDIALFGNSEKLYDYDMIVTPELEEGARKTHLAYLMDPDLMTASREEQNRVLDSTGFYSFASMDSSFSMALALEYRISYILSRKTEEGSDTEFIRSWLNDPEKLQELADAEHLRWNCAQRLLGYRLPDAGQERIIAERQKGRKVKDDELLMHPALVDNERLPEAERLADEILRSLNPEAKKTNYTLLDKAILMKMLEITGYSD